jgi:DNA-binding NarL/FixJ family response regulator
LKDFPRIPVCTLEAKIENRVAIFLIKTEHLCVELSRREYWWWTTHRVILKALQQIFQRTKDFVIAGTAGDGLYAVKVARKTKPHLIMMDFRMPVMNGDEATAQILKFHPDVKIICFSGFGDKNTVKEMLKSGAEGFLLKGEADLEEIIHATKEIRQGRHYFSSSISNLIEREFSAYSPPLRVFFNSA